MGDGRPRRYAIIGATGILRPLALTLADRGDQVLALSRGVQPGFGGSEVAAGITPRSCDAHEPGALTAALAGEALDGLIAYQPAITVAAWQATTHVPQRVIVLTSRWAAPGATDAPWRAPTTTIVQLGWTGVPPRWHTAEEVSAACLAALDAQPGGQFLLGRVTPWVDQPSG